MYCLSDFCHLCLQDDKNLIDLSKNLRRNRLFAKKLNLCVSEVKWSTFKHLLVCNLCLQNLESAYNFKQRCIKSNKHLKRRISLLKGSNKLKPLGKLDVVLPIGSITQDEITQYCDSVNNTNKYETLCQMLDNTGNTQLSQPVVYAPTTGFFISNGQQISYQNIFLNFVSTNNPATGTNQPVLMDVEGQNNIGIMENDAILKQLLEIKKPEEVSVDIDPALYDFEHFLSKPLQIPISNIECKSCGKSYVTIKLLKKHFDEVHGGELPYPCTFCSSKFLLEDHLNKHMKMHVELNSDTLVGTTVNLDNLWKLNTAEIRGNMIADELDCNYCLKLCNSHEELEQHIQNFHKKPNERKAFIKGLKTATCHICKRDFSTRSYLEQHMKLHQSKDDVEVIINADGTERKEDANNFSEDVGEIGSEVGKENIINKNLKLPSKNVDNNNIKIDGNEMNDNEDPRGMSVNDVTLNEFIIVGFDGKPACGFCKKSYERKASLKRHIRSLHVKMIRYQCHLCGTKFNEGFRLTCHLRSHYSSLTCSECNRTFSSVSEISTHMTTSHLEFKRIDCNVCYVSFDQLAPLKPHVDGHLSEMSYNCHICDKIFWECRELTKHFSEHDKIKSCGNCNQMFYNEEEFISHQEGCAKKEYKCVMCPQAFQTKTFFKLHLKTKHPVEFSKEQLPDKGEVEQES